MFNYRCRDCGAVFEHLKMHLEDADPGCPVCAARTDAMPARVNIKTNKSRAIDITQRIAEEDYGMTNMRDNLREGDIAAYDPPAPKPEHAKAVDSFWQSSPELISVAKQNAKLASKEGLNPLTLLQRKIKSDGVRPIELLKNRASFRK